MPNPSVSISTIICTCGREDFLRKALLSLTQQSLPLDQYEVIVVENGSQRGAEIILHEFLKQIPHLRYCWEPILGLSRARNAGLKIAQGSYVAFLDDDAQADRLWLGSILKTFVAYPQAGVVGGKIKPIWEQPQPAWLTDDLLIYLSVLDYGDQVISLEEKRLFGTNIAFVKKILEEIGGFSMSLGRVGDSLLSGDEILVQNQIQNRGYELIYNPEILVQHFIHAERLTKEWFEKRAKWEGLTMAIIDSARNWPAKAWLLFCQLLSFIRKPRQLLSIILNLKDDWIFSERIIAKIKISHVKNILKI